MVLVLGRGGFGRGFLDCGVRLSFEGDSESEAESESE